MDLVYKTRKEKDDYHCCRSEFDETGIGKLWMCFWVGLSAVFEIWYSVLQFMRWKITNRIEKIYSFSESNRVLYTVLMLLATYVVAFMFFLSFSYWSAQKIETLKLLRLETISITGYDFHNQQPTHLIKNIGRDACLNACKKINCVSFSCSPNPFCSKCKLYFEHPFMSNKTLMKAPANFYVSYKEGEGEVRGADDMFYSVPVGGVSINETQQACQTLGPLHHVAFFPGNYANVKRKILDIQYRLKANKGLVFLMEVFHIDNGLIIEGNKMNGEDVYAKFIFLRSGKLYDVPRKLPTDRYKFYVLCQADPFNMGRDPVKIKTLSHALLNVF